MSNSFYICWQCRVEMSQRDLGALDGMTVHPDLELLRSPIPDWLTQALAIDRGNGFVEVEGCPIHYLSWGSPSSPPLLFVHGRMSHARCWAFVAPLLARRFHCVAFDLSGMGDSGHRDTYTYDVRGERPWL